MIIEILLVLVVLVVLVVLIILIKRGKVEQKDVESAISNVLMKLGFDEKIGRVMTSAEDLHTRTEALDKNIGMLRTYAEDVRKDYRSLEKMLRVPIERASLGEIGLEKILSDQLPPDKFGIRERILDGKTPDANIKSTEGIICIDSKFPLDNYRKMIDVEDTKEKEKFKNLFLKSIKRHLDKVADDYVHPEKGSAEFAFAFIPSESVYYFLVTKAYKIIQNYTTKGVQVVSPLTLSITIVLIKGGVHAKKLSEQAEKVRNDIINLSQLFDDVDKRWRVFYGRHFKNAGKKAEELDKAYTKLKEEFDKISKLSEEE